MSTHTPNDHEHGGHGHGSEDAVDYVKVIGIGVASLALFALATWWAAIILKKEVAKVQEQTGVARPAEQTQIGQPEIGIVDQVPFVSDTRLDQWRKQHAERLNSYGWVDRAHGIAHIPIEQAMDKVAGGALPAGAPK